MYGNDMVKARRARRIARLDALRKRGAHVDSPYRYAGHKAYLAALARRRDFRAA